MTVQRWYLLAFFWLLLVSCSPPARNADLAHSPVPSVTRFSPTAPPAASPTATQATAPSHTATVAPESTRLPLPTSTTYRLDSLPEGEWVRVQSMPTGRAEMQAAVLDGRIYVAGGLTSSMSFVTTRAFESYDPISNRWAQHARLPIGLHHFMMTTHQGRIWLFGGGSDAECDTCLDANSVFSYDPAADRWTDHASMPEGRVAGAAVSIGDEIYIAGGFGSDPAVEEPLRDLLRYSPSSDSWERLAPLNQLREHTAAVAHSGRIYLFAGRWDDDLKSVELYDLVTNTWTLGPPMREARAGHGATVIGDKIYVAGGERVLTSYPGSIVTTVEVYDPVANRWVGRFDLPHGMHGAPVAALDGILYIIGGSRRPDAVDASSTLWAYRLP